MVAQLISALKILRRKQVEARVGLKHSALYDRLNPKSPRYDPDFPKPIELGDGPNPPVGWLEHEIDAYLIAKIEKTRKVQHVIDIARIEKIREVQNEIDTCLIPKVGKTRKGMA